MSLEQSESSPSQAPPRSSHYLLAWKHSQEVFPLGTSTCEKKKRFRGSPPGGNDFSTKKISRRGETPVAKVCRALELCLINAPLFLVCLSLNDCALQARIADLRALVADLEGRVVSNRAYSREVLPPMDGTTVY